MDFCHYSLLKSRMRKSEREGSERVKIAPRGLKKRQICQSDWKIITEKIQWKYRTTEHITPRRYIRYNTHTWVIHLFRFSIGENELPFPL